MAPSNVEAIVVVLDVGTYVAENLEYELQTFFEKSRSCLIRIIERKIFSHPNDLIALVLMGSEETNNNLATNDNGYRHISIGMELSNPSWDILEIVRDKIHTTKYSADWIEAMLVAADYLDNGLTKKVAHKKIVMMTDLKSSVPKMCNSEVPSIIDRLKKSDTELIVIGPDIWTDDEESEPTEQIKLKSSEQLQNQDILKQFISEMDTTTCSFEDAIYQMLFHKKKATNPNAWNVDLRIGQSIAIPVSGFNKIRDDKTLGEWKKAFKNPVTKSPDKTETIARRKSYYKKEDNAVDVDELDIVNGYLYGQKIVPFTDLDQDMEYKSGPKCLTLYGFTNAANVNWNNLTGDGTTYVVGRKGDENARVAIETLVTLMDELNLVAIVRKVYNNNNAPHMNVLFPVKEDNYKCLSMVALSFKEDYRYMSFPPLKKKLYNKEQEQAIDSLIDSMDLNEIDENGKKLFCIENSINPTLQHFFDTLAHRAKNPNDSLPQIRPEVKELMEVPPALSKRISEPLKNIKEHFELTVKEKSKGSKHWTNQKLKTGDDTVIDESDGLKIDPDQINALSVVATQVTYIGTAEPVKDFKTLMSYGEPIDSLAEQMKEVIERLVLLAFGSNYSKPLTALKALREECMSSNPTFYNKWMTEFKSVLFERSKEGFFQMIVDNKLGLIVKSENEQSGTNDNEAAAFYRTEKLSSNNMDVDTSELNDLFDD